MENATLVGCAPDGQFLEVGALDVDALGIAGVHDSQKLNGLSSAQQTIVIARLANVLMAAAGVATEEESCDDER
ncbi:MULTISPECIES: hypothetical protein [unclassified Mesorhizobium]|uniref:hypothetical protein n=1 Tax=unclassified Mesorhizobium TaxID=325217 RepID=UPI00333D456E